LTGRTAPLREDPLERRQPPGHRGLEQRAAAERAAFRQPHLSHLAAIRDVLPADGYFVDEISQIGFFGNVRADQERLYGRQAGATLTTPAIVAPARSFGHRDIAPRTPARLRAVLDEALADHRPPSSTSRCRRPRASRRGATSRPPRRPELRDLRGDRPGSP